MKIILNCPEGTFGVLNTEEAKMSIGIMEKVMNTTFNWLLKQSNYKND